MEHLVEIILAVISFISSAGFVVSRTQLRKSKAEAEKEELDLSASYVESFKRDIYEPLQAELLRLRKSIEKINTCPYRGNCPVAGQLLNDGQATDNCNN